MLLNLKTRFKCFLKRLWTPTAILGRRARIIYIPKITIEASLDVKRYRLKKKKIEEKSLTRASPDLGVTSLEIVLWLWLVRSVTVRIVDALKARCASKDLKREDSLHSQASDDIIRATAGTQLNEIKALKNN